MELFILFGVLAAISIYYYLKDFNEATPIEGIDVAPPCTNQHNWQKVLMVTAELKGEYLACIDCGKLAGTTKKLYLDDLRKVQATVKAKEKQKLVQQKLLEEKTKVLKEFSDIHGVSAADVEKLLDDLIALPNKVWKDLE